MESIVTQRVNEYRRSLDLSILAFSKAIGINQTTLNKQLKEDGIGVSVSTITQILTAYPTLSAEWLLRGDGEMEKGEWKVAQYIPIQDTELVNALQSHIKDLQAERDRLLAERKEWQREKMAAPIGYDIMANETNPIK